MANLDYPSGFRAKYRLGGGSLSTIEWDLSATNSEIGVDGLVERRSDGYADRVQAASTTIIGTAAEYKAANSGGKIKVYPHVDTVYEAQVNDATVNVQTDLDLLYDVVTGAPNSVTKVAIDEIDGASQAATATLPIKILKVAPSTDSNGNVLGEFVKVECIVNQGIFKAGALG